MRSSDAIDVTPMIVSEVLRKRIWNVENESFVGIVCAIIVGAFEPFV